MSYYFKHQLEKFNDQALADFFELLITRVTVPKYLQSEQEYAKRLNDSQSSIKEVKNKDLEGGEVQETVAYLLAQEIPDDERDYPNNLNFFVSP